VIDPLFADLKRVNPCVLPGNATVIELSKYLVPTSTIGEEPIKGVIYADSHGGPGALGGVTDELIFNSSDSAGWYYMRFPVPLDLTAGRYWIGVITGQTGK
jgi:hypothetical protein